MRLVLSTIPSESIDSSTVADSAHFDPLTVDVAGKNSLLIVDGASAR